MHPHSPTHPRYYTHKFTYRFERGAAYERTARLLVWAGAAPEDLATFQRTLQVG